MKYLIFSLLALFSVSPALAFVPQSNTTSEPYEIFMMADIPPRQYVYLGHLKGYPDMYEFTLDASTTVFTQIMQVTDKEMPPVPFSLIAIRQNNRGGGVTEAGRLGQPVEEWTTVAYPKYALDFLSSTPLVLDLGPGTYRIEISTAQNLGRYALLIGSDVPSRSYGGIIRDIRTVQAHFGKNWWWLLLSSFVLYPLLILVFVLAGLIAWRYRRFVHYAP